MADLIRKEKNTMKKLMVTVAIAALAVPLGFAQQAHGKTNAAVPSKHASTPPGASSRQTVELSSLPQATREAITKAAGSGTVTRIVSVTKNGTVTYQAHVTNGKKRSVMTFDASGNQM
jgi:hypothetical protein